MTIINDLVDRILNLIRIFVCGEIHNGNHTFSTVLYKENYY